MNKKYKLGITFSLFSISLFCINVLANSNSTSKGQNISRGKVYSSKYMCSEDCTINPEEEIINNFGKKIYKKNVTVNKRFQKINKNNQLLSEGNINLDVTFEYDKASFVNVDTSEAKQNKDSSNWKIRNTIEFHPDNDFGLISNKYAMYKKSIFGLGNYELDGHSDILCSKNGEILINTNLN